MRHSAPPVAWLVLLLGACGGNVAPEPTEQRDPAVVGALNDPLMSDPDLSARNEGAAALTVKSDDGLPLLPANSDAIEAARAEAIAMTGGEGRIAPVPPATGRVPALALRHTPADHLALLKDRTRCRAALSESTIWAARLPPALPVYPRGATAAATGGAGPGCRVVAVVFTTPVPANEVLAFYWQRASAARLAPVHRSAGAWSVLQGSSKGLAFDMRVAEAGRLTTVELAAVTG